VLTEQPEKKMKKNLLSLFIIFPFLFCLPKNEKLLLMYGCMKFPKQGKTPPLENGKFLPIFFPLDLLVFVPLFLFRFGGGFSSFNFP
jgi:hypothetical protein